MCVCTRGRGLFSMCWDCMKRMSLALFSRWRLYIDNFTPSVDLMNDSAQFFCNCCVFCVLCECSGHYEDVVLFNLSVSEPCRNVSRTLSGCLGLSLKRASNHNCPYMKTIFSLTACTVDCMLQKKWTEKDTIEGVRKVDNGAVKSLWWPVAGKWRRTCTVRVYFTSATPIWH